MECKNCGQEVSGNYCSSCSQSTSTQRFTRRDFWGEFLYGFTSWNRGFFYTLARLFISPGRLMKEYIAGRRVQYYRPIPLLIIIAAIYGVVCTTLGIKPSGLMAVDEDLGEVNGVLRLVYGWLSSPAFMAIVMLPLYALSARFALRKLPTRYNFIEYLFIFAFVGVQSLIIETIFKVIGHFSEGGIGAFGSISGLILFGIVIWDMTGLFDIKWEKAMIKTLKLGLVVLGWIILMATVFVLLVLAFAYIYKLFV